MVVVLAAARPLVPASAGGAHDPTALVVVLAGVLVYLAVTNEASAEGVAELEQGVLQVPFGPTLPGLRYYLLRSRANIGNAALERVATWVREAFAEPARR